MPSVTGNRKKLHIAADCGGPLRIAAFIGTRCIALHFVAIRCVSLHCNEASFTKRYEVTTQKRVVEHKVSNSYRRSAGYVSLLQCVTRFNKMVPVLNTCTTPKSSASCHGQALPLPSR